MRGLIHPLGGAIRCCCSWNTAPKRPAPPRPPGSSGGGAGPTGAPPPCANELHQLVIRDHHAWQQNRSRQPQRRAADRRSLAQQAAAAALAERVCQPNYHCPQCRTVPRLLRLTLSSCLSRQSSQVTCTDKGCQHPWASQWGQGWGAEGVGACCAGGVGMGGTKSVVGEGGTQRACRKACRMSPTGGLWQPSLAPQTDASYARTSSARSPRPAGPEAGVLDPHL